MKHKTESLLAALKLIKDSLHSLDFIPILSHCCFDDNRIYAYDDTTAVVVFYETGLKCAVHGSTLISVLEKAGEESELVLEGSKLTVSSDHGYVDLPALSEDEFLFQAPDEEVKATVPLNSVLLKALQTALVSVGADSLHPSHTGVTIIGQGSKLKIYSTDNTTLTAISPNVLLRPRAVGTWVVPKQAIEQLVKLFSSLGEVTATLFIADTFLRVEFDGATSVKFISKLIDATPENFEELLKAVIDMDGSKFNIPQGLEQVLSNVLTVQDKELEKKCTVSAVDADNSLIIDAVGSRGEVHGNLQCDITGKSNTVTLNPAFFLRALSFSTHACLNSRALVLTGDGITHLIGLN